METRPYLQLVTPHDMNLAFKENETLNPILVGDNVAPLVHNLLLVLGEDPAREGLQRTPERVSRMFGELLSGYQTDLTSLVNGAVFASETQGVVTVRDIEFYSLCEHHLLPFYGKAHVAYIPDGKIIGLSKIPRLVDMYSRRLQMQEHMTQQIAEALESILSPKGVAIMVEGVHLCAMMRGVKKDQANMVTQTWLGAFNTDSNLRQEFLSLVNRRSA